MHHDFCKLTDAAWLWNTCLKETWWFKVHVVFISQFWLFLSCHMLPETWMLCWNIVSDQVFVKSWLGDSHFATWDVYASFAHFIQVLSPTLCFLSSLLSSAIRSNPVHRDGPERLLSLNVSLKHFRRAGSPECVCQSPRDDAGSEVTWI